MTAWDVTAIGEGGLRLSSPPGHLLERATTLDVAIAGAEANVLSSLTALGWRTAWSSALPETPLGRRVERELRANGVGTDLVAKVPEGRVGVYFVEYGAAPRPTQVHFDRKDTVFAQMTSAQVPWDRLLDTRVLHLTGITAAIFNNDDSIVLEAARRASLAGVLVSFDVNYRARMWPLEHARPALLELIAAADIVLIRQQDAQLLFGTESAEGSLDKVLAHSSARHVAVTTGVDGAIGSVYGKRVTAPATSVEIMDRLGAGDAFAAGFLHRLLTGGDASDALSYATVMAGLCLSQLGEQVVVTRTELESLVTAPGSSLDR